MVLEKNKIYKNLKKKGFIDSETHSGDHKYLEFYHNNKLICTTKLSHGSKKDIDAFLIKQMSTQCRISKQEFADLVNCPLSAEEYLEILDKKGDLD